MNLYLLQQEQIKGFDTYDAIIVCAASAEDAVKISPETIDPWRNGFGGAWALSTEFVTAIYIGIAADNIREGHIVLASFNAG